MFDDEKSVELQKVLSFLDEIGIGVEEKVLPETTFVPGLELGSNCIYIDYAKLLYPGDLLHEAGHFAVATSQERSCAGTTKQAEDWPNQGQEIAAILWSYAATLHLNLPIEFVFHKDGYKGDSEWLIDTFESGNYIGLPFLEWIGLASGKVREGEKLPLFPEMIRWVRQ